MQELYTRAWVLERSPVGEMDEMVTLYTEEYGKVKARARSIRKITSKVSAQLQPLCFSKVRLMRRNGPRDGFSILDALIDDSLKSSKEQKHLIPIARLLLDMTHEWEKDVRLWEYVEKMAHTIEDRECIQKTILSILGFEATHAVCVFCKKSSVHAFLLQRHEFVCKECASKMDESEVVFI